ncbi:MAG: hypothetical protein K2G80_00185, partial [Bacteroidales bacterium]|nr:hypothetical protein [Bacteroidales bacterium]
MNTEADKFNQVCRDLESGRLRVAERVDGKWVVNSWVMEVILSGCGLGRLNG